MSKEIVKTFYKYLNGCLALRMNKNTCIGEILKDKKQGKACNNMNG